MNIFVTGATGFVGRSIIKGLKACGHSVSILALPNEEVSGLKDIQIHRGDITKKETLIGVMRDQDIVIHLAGAVGYGQQMDLCRKINVDGTVNMALEAHNCGVKRFIHMSSVAVYGRQNQGAISESTPFLKIGDPYGDTKIDAEIELNSIEKRTNLNITYVRPTVIFGPGDDKFLPKLLENIKSGNAKIIGDGKNRVDLIHIDDVVRFFVAILDNPKSYGQAYNLTNSENGNWDQFLETMGNELKLKSNVGHIPYPIAYAVAGVMEFVSHFTKKSPKLTRYAVRVVGKHYNFRMEKAQNELGFMAEIGIKEGIAPLIESYQRGLSC